MLVCYVPAVLRRFLGILGASGLVIAHPLLDLLGNAPATFDLYHFEGQIILVFAALMIVVPAVLVGAIVEICYRINPRSGEVLHHVMIGVLLGGFGILLAKSAFDIALLNLAIGAVIGGGGGFLHHRYLSMRTWLMMLSAASILFFVQFSFFSPVAKRIDAATGSPQISAPIILASPTDSAIGESFDPDQLEADPAALPSVYMLILDELPTQTLLTEGGVIDPTRFPALAGFAEDATFYRHHTTASNFTHSAVPGILDGKEPSGSPVWTDHPENLFSMFAFSHHLVVSEVLTRLCGFEGCQELKPPPPPTTIAPPTTVAPASAAPSTSVPVTTTTTVPEPEPPTSEPDRDWGGLLSASWNVWKDRLNPSQPTETEGFDQFAENLDTEPTTTSTTSTTTTTTSKPEPLPEAATTSVPPVSVVPLPEISRPAEEDEAERREGMPLASQPSRLTEFLAAVRPSDPPVFGYLHLVLPHFPWLLREDGTQYISPRISPIAEAEWEMQVLRQRHLLQTQYADRVVGEFLAHLVAHGLYEDAVIVIMGDHGMGFAPNTDPRSFTPENLAAVAYTPLLIKIPGQTGGVINDENLSTTDFPNTLAALLNIGLPWETDGAAAGSQAVKQRGATKTTYQFTVVEGGSLGRAIEFDDNDEFANLMAGILSPSIPGQDPVTSLYADLAGASLIGGNADEIWDQSVTTSARIDQLNQIAAPEDGSLPGEIAGRIPGAPVDATVIVAVNNRIIGVSPLFTSGGQEHRFLVLLPADALKPSTNEVRIGLRYASGDIVELRVQ